MCDYSLESYISRPAKVGERLRVYEFPSLSAGMIGTCEGPLSLLAQAMRMLKHTGGDWDFGCAVCLQPGTELMFSGPIRLSNDRATLDSAAAKFVQLKLIKKAVKNFAGEMLEREVYEIDGRGVLERDAVELPDGSRYRFCELASGQVCTVVQLPRAVGEQDHKPTRAFGAFTEQATIDDLEIAR